MTHRGPGRARGLLVAATTALLSAALVAACSLGKGPPPTTTTTTTTTLVAPPGSIEAVAATARAFADDHRAQRFTDAAALFTEAAAGVCTTRPAFATALKGVYDTTSVTYQFAGIGRAYTEDHGVGTFEVQLVEINPGTGAPYDPEPRTVKLPFVPGPNGWLFAKAFPPNITTFC